MISKIFLEILSLSAPGNIYYQNLYSVTIKLSIVSYSCNAIIVKTGIYYYLHSYTTESSNSYKNLLIPNGMIAELSPIYEIADHICKLHFSMKTFLCVYMFCIFFLKVMFLRQHPNSTEV